MPFELLALLALLLSATSLGLVAWHLRPTSTVEPAPEPDDWDAFHAARHARRKAALLEQAERNRGN